MRFEPSRVFYDSLTKKLVKIVRPLPEPDRIKVEIYGGRYDGDTYSAYRNSLAPLEPKP